MYLRALCRHESILVSNPVRTLTVAVLFVVTLTGSRAAAQSYINQTEVESILNGHVSDLESLPEVTYEYYVWSDKGGSSIRARNSFFKILGKGNVALGQERGKLVELLNRRLFRNVDVGDKIVIPSQFELDFRAYSPFPHFYDGGRDFDKLFIIDKSIQAFAAYEYGKLVRWGIVNTGSPENPTPAGRYNFNWKEEFRVSSLSPPGESWDMYWVFNFHESRGMHLHQYEMPTGGPTSHGCVRLVDADAVWVYNWADGWKIGRGSGGFPSGYGNVIEPGTTLLVINEDPVGDPYPFEDVDGTPVLRTVTLPDHPYDVPPGTTQQKFFDRLFRAESR